MNNTSIKIGNLFDKDFSKKTIYRQEIANIKNNLSTGDCQYVQNRPFPVKTKILKLTDFCFCPNKYISAVLYSFSNNKMLHRSSYSDVCAIYNLVSAGNIL